MVNEELNDSLAGQKDQLNSIKAQMEDLQSRLDALYEAIELKQFTLEDLKPRILRHKSAMDRLITSKDDLESQRNQNWVPEIDPITLRAYIDDFLALLDEGTVAEKRAFVRGFVRQLTVKDGIATLEYTLPLASSTLSLSEGKDGVLSFERKTEPPPCSNYRLKCSTISHKVRIPEAGAQCTVSRTFSTSFTIVY